MGVVCRRRQRHVAGGEAAAGGDQGLAGAEVHARLAQIFAGDRGFRECDAVALALDILLNDDRVGAVRHRRTGEDAHRLARTKRALEGVARRRLADYPQDEGRCCRVDGAHA